MYIYLLNKLLNYLRLKDSAIYSTRQSHNCVGLVKSYELIIEWEAMIIVWIQAYTDKEKFNGLQNTL